VQTYLLSNLYIPNSKTEMNDYKKAAEITEEIINQSGEFDCIYFDYSLIKK